MNEIVETVPTGHAQKSWSPGLSISMELLCQIEPDPTIFVVDDYPGLAEVAKVVLEAEGYRVQAFRERERALEAFIAAKPRPALLVTDYRGGAMSGIALIKICKAMQPQLKALLVSAIDRRTLSTREMMLVDGSLGKPYSAACLIYEVRRLCGRASLEKRHSSVR